MLDEAVKPMSDAENYLVDYHREAFLRITGSKASDGLGFSVLGLRKQCPKKSHITQVPPRESFSKHANFVEHGHWKLINGLYNGLDTLLRATEKGRGGFKLGARSLFSTCLRKIPDYIAEEQQRLTAEDPESDIDIASIVYGDLEALGSSPTAGWKSLREVARAHGISLLGNAFREGLLNPSVARGLIHICLRYHAYDEAQHFVECITNSMKPLRRSKSTPVRLFAREFSAELSTLKYFVTFSGRFGFLYQQITTMICNGILPLEWISSPGMVECWNGVIWSITQEDEHSKAAAVLLQTIISMAYGGPYRTADDSIRQIRLKARGASSASIYENFQSIEPIPLQSPPSSQTEANDTAKALGSVISNILTVLCAVGLLGRSTTPVLIPLKTLPLVVMHNLALIAHKAVMIKEYDGGLGLNLDAHAEQTCLPFLAAKLIEDTAGNSGGPLVLKQDVPLDVITRLGCSEALPSCAASFLCAVAHCCQRATSADLFDYMQSIVKQFAAISTSQGYEKATKALCGQIALAAAFEYSEETNQPKHLDWALDLEQTITGTTVETSYRTPGKTPVRRPLKSRSGYRWEEGICEWVAKTPGTLWPGTESIGYAGTTPSDSDSDGDCTTPSASPLKQGLLDLLQPSPWSIGNIPEIGRVLSQGRVHLSNHSHFKALKTIGKTSHVDEMAETSDELQTIHHDGISTIAHDDTEDELSTPSSSQDLAKIKLREVTNIGASIGRKRAATYEKSTETRKRRALCLGTKPKSQRPQWGPLTINESFDESEDELSTWIC